MFHAHPECGCRCSADPVGRKEGYCSSLNSLTAFSLSIQPNGPPSLLSHKTAIVCSTAVAIVIFSLGSETIAHNPYMVASLLSSRLSHDYVPTSTLYWVSRGTRSLHTVVSSSKHMTIRISMTLVSRWQIYVILLRGILSMSLMGNTMPFVFTALSASDHEMCDDSPNSNRYRIRRLYLLHSLFLDIAAALMLQEKFIDPKDS
jgi:hypothetical protein